MLGGCRNAADLDESGVASVAKVKRTPGPGAKQLQKMLHDLGNADLRAGWFESAKYEDGTPVAYVATIQEYGYGPIPPRPFMRTAVATKQGEWGALSRRLAKQLAAGGMDTTAALGLLGEMVVGDIKDAISAVTTPPLKESTIDARKRRHSRGIASEKPLVDSGTMIGTVSYEVDKK